MKQYKDYFYGMEEGAYFYTGAQAPALKSSVEVLEQYLKDKSLGDHGRDKAEAIENKLKSNLAQMIRAKEKEIAFLGNASEAINSLVEALNVQPGENIVLNELEYSSVYLPWIKQNIETRFVKPEQGRIKYEDIEKQIDEKTRLVAVSHTSYINGFRHNMKKLREITNKYDIALLVDATQSLGAVDVNSEHFDMMVSSSYKWLLGTHGLGVLYVSEEYLNKLTPTRIGWRSVQSLFTENRFETYDLFEDARKFEVGWNNYAGIYVLNHSTNLLLDIGIDRIENHILDIGDYLIEELKKQQWTIISSPYREERSGNISIAVEDGEKMMKQLEDKYIKVWGGDGRIRISVHFYTTKEDIDFLMEGLYPYSPLKQSKNK